MSKSNNDTTEMRSAMDSFWLLTNLVSNFGAAECMMASWLLLLMASAGPQFPHKISKLRQTEAERARSRKLFVQWQQHKHNGGNKLVVRATHTKSTFGFRFQMAFLPNLLDVGFVSFRVVFSLHDCRFQCVSS